MKENNIIPVNHEVLIWARETIALNRTNASLKTGILPKRLLHLEQGEKNPTLEELIELSKAYKRTLATLLLSNPPKEKPLPKDRRTINSKDIGNYHEKTIMAIRKARALAVSLVDLKKDADILTPFFPYKSSINDNPSTMAKNLYKELDLKEIRASENTNHVLEAYIEKIESLGVAVFQLSLTQDGLRGFSMVDEPVPIIGIKRGGEQATAKIFTLFHELGHVILSAGGMCDLSENSNLQIEKWCNAFASEILIPASELRQINFVKEKSALKEKIWSKKELVELANHFHVGPLSILRSLLENGLTTSEYYRDRHSAWNKPSFGRTKNPEGRNIAKETIKEKGRTYISLAFSAFDQNKIDLKDLSDYLGVKLSYIPKTRQLLNA